MTKKEYTNYNKFYIGKTNRNFLTRLKEYSRYFTHGGKKNQNLQNTSYTKGSGTQNAICRGGQQ